MHCRPTTENEEERKLVRCLRKSTLSPYKKHVICTPSSSVNDRGSLSALSQIETRSLTSPRNKGLSSKMKPSSHHETALKTQKSSLHRSTPNKRALSKPRMSTPLRKTKHYRAEDRKKTSLTPRRTPRKKFQTPQKSAKRTPGKSMLIVRVDFCSYSFAVIIVFAFN